MKKCILNLKTVCDDCGECDDRCQFDPNKTCDNCFKCLEFNREYAEIHIDGIFVDEEEAEEDRLQRSFVEMLCQPESEYHEEMDIEEDTGDATGSPDDED